MFSQKIAEMRTQIQSAYKSNDTEEWFDRVFTKPLGYLWALLFMKLKWTPNMVTVLSLIIGGIGGSLFYYRPLSIRIIGILLVIWANILDSTDGQIARLTDQRSKLGRFLDGLSDFVWYGAIYISLALRMTGDTIPFTNIKWGIWIWVLLVPVVPFFHAKQSRMADYYRNIHLHFLKNRYGDDLDSSADIRPEKEPNPILRLYLYVYRIYTRSQEKHTPDFQAMMKALKTADADTFEAVRNEYLTRSRKYIQLTNILTFNARAYAFFICELFNLPVLYIVLVLTVFNALCSFMCGRYEKIARDIHKKFRLDGWESVKHHLNYKPVFFAIGLIGVAVMIWRMDVKNLDWNMILHRMPILLPMLLLLYLGVYVMHTLSQFAVIGFDRERPPFFQMLRITLSTFALNNATPVSFAGGEPFKIMELKSYLGTAAATASAFSFSIMNGLSLLSLWLTGSAMYFVLYGFTANTLRTVVMLIAFTACLIVLILVLIPKRTGVLKAVMRFGEHLPLLGDKIARFNKKHDSTLTEIDVELAEFKAHPERLWPAFLLEHTARMMEAFELFLIYRMLGQTVSYPQALLILTITSMLGNLMFFIPMQLGAREGGMALGTTWCGIDDAAGVTASLFARLREVIFTMTGVALILIDTRKKSREEDE